MHRALHTHFFHVERENQPDFEDQHRATWHLNPQIPVCRTEDFDAAGHACRPSAQHHLLQPSLEYMMKMLTVQAGLVQMLIYHQ